MDCPETILGPPDPETALLAYLLRPQWKRGLALARVLVRNASLSDHERIDRLEVSCPPFEEDREWFRAVLAELLKVARIREHLPFA